MANPKPTPIQSAASDFLRAVKRLLKVSQANPPSNDEAYAHAITLRTFARIERGFEEARSDAELAAAMKLSLDLLRGLELLRLAAARDLPDDEHDDILDSFTRAQDLEQLIEELEAIRMREREE